jgi:hypothetical protein
MISSLPPGETKFQGFLSRGNFREGLPNKTNIFFKFLKQKVKYFFTFFSSIPLSDFSYAALEKSVSPSRGETKSFINQNVTEFYGFHS